MFRTRRSQRFAEALFEEHRLTFGAGLRPFLAAECQRVAVEISGGHMGCHIWGSQASPERVVRKHLDVHLCRLQASGRGSRDLCSALTAR